MDVIEMIEEFRARKPIANVIPLCVEVSKKELAEFSKLYEPMSRMIHKEAFSTRTTQKITAKGLQPHKEAWWISCGPGLIAV